MAPVHEMLSCCYASGLGLRHCRAGWQLEYCPWLLVFDLLRLQLSSITLTL